VQEDAKVDCPSPVASVATFFSDGFAAWDQVISSGATAAATSGTAVGAAVVARGTPMATLIFEMMAAFVYEEGATGGMGSGWGMTVQCAGQVLFTFGGGAGGGMNLASDGFGGGGGGQVPGTTLSVGGGGGCYETIDRSGVARQNASLGLGSASCDSSPDANSNTNLVQMRRPLANAVAACPAGALMLCGSGGGGGGIAYPPDKSVGCQYGAGYSVAFSAPLTPSSARSAEPATGAEPGVPGAAAAGVCAAGTAEDGTSVAVQYCSAACIAAPSYYACYCPCFKAKITSLGLAWGATISCT
jgi:hypothetical protein